MSEFDEIKSQYIESEQKAAKTFRISTDGEGTVIFMNPKGSSVRIRQKEDGFFRVVSISADLHNINDSYLSEKIDKGSIFRTGSRNKEEFLDAIKEIITKADCEIVD